MRVYLLLLFASLLITGCRKKNEGDALKPSSNLYFPPSSIATWDTVSPSSLGWDKNEMAQLDNYLGEKKTKAFIILKNGRIARERYFGTFTADSNWYWASAGKTLTAFLVGTLQQEGKININDKTAQYLGAGWTSLPMAKENLITIRHQLTMTTGLNDNVAESDCTVPSCLQYQGDAGTRWSYHNAPYTLLEKVVESATGASYNEVFRQKIKDKIGMNGMWIKTGFNNVYFSTPRSMARFGLLLLNKGKWNADKILADANYLSAQTNSSQTLNPSYGYLTWLNGKSGYMLPQTQFTFNGSLIPNAPPDTYAALGKNDQKIYVIPSQGLVVIRMGESAGASHLAASSFDNELWEKLRRVLKL
ncbi:MAG TPA: serine hydrolase [Chitinophagaceae bacterium]|nr:serine hydrolase [Chitinophagaceae bacterium]